MGVYDLNFWIYGIDASPEASPTSATLHVKLDDPPILNGEYDNFGDYPGRGSVHRTLGGIVVQDFGVSDTDRRIILSGSDALSASTISTLKTMHDIIGGQYYLSVDIKGETVLERFKVQFSRDPAGLRYWRNLAFATNEKTFYSYEMNFIVLEKRV